MFYLFNVRAVIHPHENLSSHPLSELFQRAHDLGKIYGQIDPSLFADVSDHSRV